MTGGRKGLFGYLFLIECEYLSLCFSGWVRIELDDLVLRVSEVRHDSLDSIFHFI